MKLLLQSPQRGGRQRTLVDHNIELIFKGAGGKRETDGVVGARINGAVQVVNERKAVSEVQPS